MVMKTLRIHLSNFRHQDSRIFIFLRYEYCDDLAGFSPKYSQDTPQLAQVSYGLSFVIAVQYHVWNSVISYMILMAQRKTAVTPVH